GQEQADAAEPAGAAAAWRPLGTHQPESEAGEGAAGSDRPGADTRGGGTWPVRSAPRSSPSSLPHEGSAGQSALSSVTRSSSSTTESTSPPRSTRDRRPRPGRKPAALPTRRLGRSSYGWTWI